MGEEEGSALGLASEDWGGELEALGVAVGVLDEDLVGRRHWRRLDLRF